MRERQEIVRMWQQGGVTVLVTLVRAAGSSYRQPGARLLLGPNGVYAGTISGGCLEAEVVRKAAWMVREGAMVERYSTMFDDTAEVPFGLGCGGIVDLLLEPTDTPECTALIKAMEQALHGEMSTVLTWLPQGGRRLARAVLAENGDFAFASEELTEPELVAMRRKIMRGDLVEGAVEGIVIERMVAQQRLFVLGAGDDAKPLVSMAALLGWSVIVADERTQLAKAERFPNAEKVTSEHVARLGIQALDAVVMMTHSYEQDRKMLAFVLPIGLRYLGLLGARHRSSLLVSETAAAIGWTVAECCSRIYAPVGLDLGGDGPEAIALAVIAEAQACCMGKLGASRRLSAEDVTAHLDEGEASRYMTAQCGLDVL